MLYYPQIAQITQILAVGLWITSGCPAPFFLENPWGEFDVDCCAEIKKRRTSLKSIFVLLSLLQEGLLF
jgi:hypothetical protein